MKFFRLDLLTLLISLFILNSCKNEDTIGLPTNALGSLSGSLIDTATIITNTDLDDSVVTSSLTKVPMGYFVDPVMGPTESDLVTDLNLPGDGTSYTLPTGNKIIDSAVLVLNYADGFYGDSVTSKYKVNVYQLGERLYSGTSYYNNKQWKVNLNTLLGTKSFYSRTHTKIKIDTLLSGAPDTLVSAAPQLRIPIDTGFIRSILFGAPAQQLASDLIFKNNVKGLFVTIDQNQTTGPGGIFMIKAPTDSALAVYYRVKNGTTVDTTLIYLSVSQSAAQIKYYHSAAVLNAIAKTQANAANHTNNSDNVIYLQGLAGLRAKISFPYIKQLFKSIPGGINSVIINRAELVVTPVPGSDIPSYLAPQLKLSMYRYDIAHQRAELEDASTSDPRSYSAGAFGGYYGTASLDYHFLITSYIQDLVDGRTTDYGTYLAPIDNTNTTSIDIAATPETAGRTVAVGSDKSSPYRIKLNVIYTRIK